MGVAAGAEVGCAELLFDDLLMEEESVFDPFLGVGRRSFRVGVGVSVKVGEKTE